MIQQRAVSMCILAVFALVTYTSGCNGSGCNKTTTNPDGSDIPAKPAAPEPAATAATPEIAPGGWSGATGDRCSRCITCPGCYDVRRGNSREVELTADKIPPEIVKAARRVFAEVEPEIAFAVKVKDIKLTSIFFRTEVFVTEDGTVTNLIENIAEERIPPAAAAALREATDGMTVARFEKETAYFSEDEDGAPVKRLDSPWVVYSAQYTDGQRMGEVEVEVTGSIVVPPEWLVPNVRPQESDNPSE